MNNPTDSIIPLLKTTSRRQALKGLGLSALGLASLNALAPTAGASGPTTPQLPLDANDINILNFALNLEYLEAEFYTYATTGQGIQAQGIAVNGRDKLGNVTIKANPQVPFATAAIQQYAQEIALDERLHVVYIRDVLGAHAVARPPIDLLNSFTAAAIAAGIIGAGETFDPFADELSFLLGAFIFEDVGVTAYRGAAPLVHNSIVLSAAAGILGAEAYHAATIRTKVFEAGDTAQADAQKISDLRDILDQGKDQDQGVVLGGNANIDPTNDFAMVFARSMRQVLDIVYFAPNANKGGFFPSGINL